MTNFTSRRHFFKLAAASAMAASALPTIARSAKSAAQFGPIAPGDDVAPDAAARHWSANRCPSPNRPETHE
jgi:hypothetical protein